MGIALALCLLPVRAVVLGVTWTGVWQAPAALGTVIVGAYADIAYAMGLTIAFLIAALALRRAPVFQAVLYLLFAAVAMFSEIAALANVEIVKMLGRPFNYQWLYYSDFLRSADARQAMAVSMSWRSLSIATWSCATLLIAARLAARGLGRLRRAMRARDMVLALTPGPLLYLGIAHWYVVTWDWNQARLANPIAALGYSLVRAVDAPLLLTMPTAVGPEDFGVDRGPAPARRPPGAEAIRNVVLFLMESTAAAYVEPTGGPYPVTPNLARHAGRAAVFDTVYAHSPSTHVSLVSFLLSLYPRISYLSLTREHPEVQAASLSGALKRAGFDTAFFSSADLGFQRANDFLAHRDFDVVEDFRGRTCSRPLFTSEEWPELNGTDDRCTVDSLVEWIDARGARPFFAVLWTMQPHYPYFVADPQIDYGAGNEDLNRYLNAVREGDRAFGTMMQALEDRGQLASTLVVVAGDHGEAFGQHGQFGHGTDVYEENLRVPLLFIHARTFRGQRISRLSGVVDVAPTILWLLGRPVPETWQGRNLFDGTGTGRQYFCAPWSDYLFGFRDGHLKLILNGGENRVEVYDLAVDPGERRNIAAESAGFVRKAQEHLAAWVQYEDRVYRELTAGDGG